MRARRRREGSLGAVGDPRPLEADDVLFVVTKESWNGMVLEVVGPAKHAFVRIEKAETVKKVESDGRVGKAAAP